MADGCVNYPRCSRQYRALADSHRESVAVGVLTVTERTGVLFSRLDDPAVVSHAEDLGYDSVWASEGRGRTAFGKLERWAAVTDRIELATGIINVYSRTPATIAQAIATLDDHSNGRAILGLGVASPAMIEGFHGLPYDRPLERLHEYVTLVRHYLGDEGGEIEGETVTPTSPQFADGFDAPDRTIPIYNAALGPSNVRLTGQIADGWLPNLYPEPALADALDWLATGAERGDRRPTDVDVAMYVLAAVADDSSDALDRVATHVATYLRDVPGFYDRMAAEAGFEAAVADAKSAPSTAAAANALPRAFLEAISVSGTPPEVRAGIARLREAGVDLPIVRTPIGGDRAEERRLLRACAPS